MLRIWRAITPYRHRVPSEYRRTASVLSFNHDGLEIARVKAEPGHRWLPLWHIMVFIYLILLIRLVAFADIGPGGYNNRMEQMRNGTLLEQGAAKVMAMDPISQRLARELRGVFGVVSEKLGG